MASFRCPLCHEPLQKEEHLYHCKNRHSFDRAKSGYVNLLLVNEKNAKLPGDNKLMVAARQNFLNKGYYQPLQGALCREAAKQVLKKASPVILDAGCGEGYYTDAISGYIQKKGVQTEIFGIDISKFALDKAARRNPKISFAVASAFRLPMQDESCDLLLSLFSPYCGEEYLRVLKPDGVMILAIPGKEHLWQLKKVLYPNPYYNEVKDYALEGFSLLGAQKVETDITLENAEDIEHLFQMTPYCYRTPKEGVEHLRALKTLTTKIQFEILSYKKSD